MHLSRSMARMIAGLIVAAGLLSAPAAMADEVQVPGAEMIKPGMSSQAIWMLVSGEAITEAEVALFADVSDDVAAWQQANPEAAKQIQRDDVDLVTELGKLALWEQAAVTPEQFLAMVMKFAFAQHLANGSISVAKLERGIAGMEEMIAKSDDPDAARDRLASNLAQSKAMLALAKKAEANGNVALYTANKATIDATLQKFDMR